MRKARKPPAETDLNSITRYSATLPLRTREISPGINWLGQCFELTLGSGVVHIPNTSNYLIQGASASLLVDTGSPVFWPALEEGLKALLPNDHLDWVFPSHLEYPHSGSLELILQRYPSSRVVCDPRDFHMDFPHLVSRHKDAIVGEGLELGGGYRFDFVPAILKDLVNTLWGYEEKSQILFVVDGFSYTHHAASLTVNAAVHEPGECDLFASEIPRQIVPTDAAQLNSEALWWTRYRDIRPFMAEIRELIHLHPTRLIAPAHGGVIDNIEAFLPILEQAHDMAYVGSSIRSKL